MILNDMKSSEDIKLDDLLARLKIERDSNCVNPYPKIRANLIFQNKNVKFLEVALNVNIAKNMGLKELLSLE